MISSFPADMTSFPDKNRNDASPDIGTRDVFGFSVAVSLSLIHISEPTRP